ncbi:hypothetical protein KKI24_00600 [bacterium]|nr:hypothetical protein [bacterium]
MKRQIFRIVFNTFLIIPAVVFLFTGYRWLVSPEAAASTLMMPLLRGAALSSQIGDIGGLFLAMGLLVTGAVVSRKGDWLLSVSILLACVAIFRILAYSIHGAALVRQMVVLEIVLSIWFGIASRKISKQE